MQEIKTIEFIDAESRESGIAVVRADKQVVSLALSLMDDGDIEVFLPLEVCRSLITAMSEGVKIAMDA
jgi:hypothetical protein